MPRRPSSCISAVSSTLPSALGSSTISAPRARNSALRAASSCAAAINTFPPSSTAASGGVSSRLSITTLSGCRVVSTSRTVSRGLSSFTVPMPVSTAQDLARQAWASRRASAPVIHCETPLLRAVLPSMLAATLSRSQGRPRVMRETKPILSSFASVASSPVAICMPAAASLAMPCPATSGFGSAIAATTRATPASISASAQGGVRPKWLQGSSVTYAVAPIAAACPRSGFPGTQSGAAPTIAASAAASACGRPAFSCQPSPMTRPSLTITQPTRGFGVVLYRPRRASCRARAMKA